MKKTIFLALLGATLLALIPPPVKADVHAVIENSRTFREMTRKTTEEYWLAPDKKLWKLDSFLWITRKDLGVLWGVGRRDNTYFEQKLEPPKKAPGAAPKEDIHTLGWDFGQGPTDWIVENLEETKEVAGIVCRKAVGRGRSDYGEITVQLWLAPAATPGAADLLRVITEALRGDERRAQVADLLDKLGGCPPLDREEIVDTPIGGIMRYTSKVTKLETAEAPAGTYDLPAGAKKEDPNAAPAARPAVKAFELPAAAAVELKRLEETYRVLDQAAEKVWSGWNNYKDIPFLFTFENGLKVLIGHPNPPQGYEPLRGVTVGGRKVSVDRRQMSALELKQPLYCGGGIGSLGESGGRPVTVVDMRLTKATDNPAEKDRPFRAEDTILVLVHELFHCFQSDAVQIAYGNLNYNTDANYSLYSAVEGLALSRAYAEKDAEAAKAFLKDFLLARDLKRASMTDMQRKEESSDDVREGTAVYSEVRTLEILRDGFRPGLDQAVDPHYGGFRDIDGLMDQYIERLKKNAADLYETKGKCYNYGCFQALLLQRLFPGWQEPFGKEARFLDEELGKRLPLGKQDKDGAAKRFEALYQLKSLKTKADQAMAERAAAFKAAAGGKGLTYALSFREIGQYPSSLVSSQKSYRLGLATVYPEGVGKLAFDEVEIDVRHKPVKIDKIFHMILVDQQAAGKDKPYELTYEKQEGPETFINAVVTTPLFTLKAPKIRLMADAKRIKIWILARVKG